MSAEQNPHVAPDQLAASAVEVLTGVADEDDITESRRTWSHRVRVTGVEKASRTADRLRHARERARESLPASTGTAEQVPHVFISYSRRDKIATNVCNDLRQHGAEVWVDTESIRGGEAWATSISRGIRQADAFVLLLSTNVAKYPESVLTELGLARSLGTPIFPVLLTRMTELPEGFDLFVTGTQWTELFHPNYASGMQKLCDAVDVSATVAPSGIRQRAERMKHQMQRTAHSRQLGAKLRTYGGAVAGGAIVAVAVIGKGVAEQQRRIQLDARRREQVELEQYLQRTSETFLRAMSEVELTNGMTREEYRDDFRPAFSRILGQLQGTHPPSPAIEQRHNHLIGELQRLLEGFDAAARKADRGDELGFQRAMERLNVTWAQTITSMIELTDAAPDT